MSVSLLFDGNWQPTLLDLGFDAVENALLLTLPGQGQTLPFPRGPVRLRMKTRQSFGGSNQWRIFGSHYTEADLNALREGHAPAALDAFEFQWDNPAVGDSFEKLISPKARYLFLDTTFPQDAISGELRAMGIATRGPSSLRLGPPPQVRPR
jgi:hypothetical protein